MKTKIETKTPIPELLNEKKVLGICDYCSEEIYEGEEEDEGQELSAGDESLTLCDACYEHCVE